MHLQRVSEQNKNKKITVKKKNDQRTDEIIKIKKYKLQKVKMRSERLTLATVIDKLLLFLTE